MLDKIFQAARAFLLAEFGDDFFTRRFSLFEKFDPKKAKPALARFLKYYFQEEDLVSSIVVDGDELWSKKFYKDSLTVKISMSDGAGYFSVCIEIFPKGNEYIEGLREIFWGEFFSNKQLFLTQANYSEYMSEIIDLSRFSPDFRNHSIHQLWN